MNIYLKYGIGIDAEKKYIWLFLLDLLNLNKIEIINKALNEVFISQ